MQKKEIKAAFIVSGQEKHGPVIRLDVQAMEQMSREQLIDYFWTAFNMPEEPNHNWDAMLDWLKDLSWFYENENNYVPLKSTDGKECALVTVVVSPNTPVRNKPAQTFLEDLAFCANELSKRADKFYEPDDWTCNILLRITCGESAGEAENTPATGPNAQAEQESANEKESTANDSNTETTNKD